MTEGFSTATREMRELGFGAGMGLPNIKKNADVLRVDSRTGRGTRLEIVIRTNGHRT
jgi:anti-sigma regulatory factor (Ser/Thr protein kinase)